MRTAVCVCVRVLRACVRARVSAMAEDLGWEVRQVFVLRRFGTSTFDFTFWHSLVNAEVFIS